MRLPPCRVAFRVCFTGTTTSIGSTVMSWHTAIDPQRLALRGEPVLPDHGRSVKPGDSWEYRGIRRE